MQLSYDRNFVEGFPGMLGDNGYKKTVSLVAQEQVLYGMGLVKMQDQSQGVRLPIANVCNLTIDADLVTSNSTIVTVTVQKWGGTAITNTTSATVYASSHAATMAAIAAKIAAFTGIATCTVTDANSRTLTITATPDTTLTLVAGTTTLGSSQGAWTAAYTTIDTMFAIAHHEQGNMVASPPDTMRVNKTTITFSTDLITSNVAAGYVNGTAVTATYATSHAATMAALAALIEAIAGIATCEVSGDDLIITAQAGWSNRVNGWAVTLGSSQPTTTITNERTDGDDSVTIEASEMVNGLRRGTVWGLLEETVDSDDSVYLRYLANGTGKVRGQFRNDADSGTCILVAGARFVSAGNSDDSAPIEINYP